MAGHPIRRAVAVLCAATLTASIASITIAGEADPAANRQQPKCAGKTATIVGTKRGERIVGTPRRDVIVARGGHDRIFGLGGNDIICAGNGNDRVVGGPGLDRIWGQAGRDRLYGGPGPDFLAGQDGNDTLVGGQGVDTCLQGTGTGPWLTCELPVPIPPEPPTLVIAYADVNTNHVYDAGDVMIAKIVDSITDGAVGPGDTIKMGQYPTSPNVIKPAQLRSQFEDWRITSHTVATADLDPDANAIHVEDSLGSYFRWVHITATHDWDEYEEGDASSSVMAYIWDEKDLGDEDGVLIELLTPSQATSAIDSRSYDGVGDDGVIDVEIYAP